MDPSLRVAADPSPVLPPGFLFGVSDSGYQSEGGYNGPGEPANNWAAWERRGRAAPAGVANEFWTRFPEHFDAAAEAGCNSYRLSVEWTRCEPRRGRIDHEALEHYGRILRSCRDHGLEPIVALHHFTQPAWLGEDFWLRDSAPDEFARWVETAVGALTPHCSKWITVNEVNACAIGSYLIGYFPPGRRLQVAKATRMMDHMLAAHVKAYEVIHRLQPDAQVGTSTYAFWCYDVDHLLIDALCARAHGVDRADLGPWFETRRRAFHREVVAGVPPTRSWQDAAVHRALRAVLRVEHALPRTIEAVYASPHDRCLDVTQVNYYDPRLAKYPRRPGRRTVGGQRKWGPDPEHWEQRPGPEHLAAYLSAQQEPGLETWILENGMCNPVVDGRSHPRPDGWTRPEYFKAHLRAVVDAVDAGVNVTSYFNWAVFDNYQWGEFESCFGLHAVDREHGCKFLELDALGHDAAGALRDLTDGLRRGDRSVLR